MTEVDLALSQISSIRAQLIASTRFLGLAPSSNLLSGILAFVVAAWQSSRPGPLDPLVYIEVWAWFLLATAIIAAVRTSLRARRVHGDTAFGMLGAALQRVLPFAAAGVVISWVVCNFAVESVWLLPGLWQMLIALVGFSMITTLPRGIAWVSGWYFLCGAVVMGLAAQSETFSPWMMGIPFVVGQVFVALVLTWADGERRGCK